MRARKPASISKAGAILARVSSMRWFSLLVSRCAVLAGITLAGLLSTGPVLAQDAPQQLEHLQVVGRRDLDQMPLANFVKASQAFAQRRDLAPGATLRFVVVPRDATVPLSSIKLAIDDPHRHDVSGDIAVPMADDGSFTLPAEVTSQASDGALLRSNQPAGSLHWRPLVETPGQPEDTRRLGDLRLECQAKEAGRLNRPDLPFFARIFGGSEISECASDDEHFFLAPAPLASVILDDGSRQLEIEPDRVAESSAGRLIPRTYHLFEDGWRQRSYSPPLGDMSWPNDTLVRFHYLDPSSPASQPSQH